MKLKYRWERSVYVRDSYFADVESSVRLLVRRRRARSPWFLGKINGEFKGMWKDRERAQQRMEVIYEAQKKPAPQDEVRA